MSFKTVGTEETNTQSKSRKKIYNGQRDNTLLAKKKRQHTQPKKQDQTKYNYGNSFITKGWFSFQFFEDFLLY